MLSRSIMSPAPARWASTSGRRFGLDLPVTRGQRGLGNGNFSSGPVFLIVASLPGTLTGGSLSGAEYATAASGTVGLVYGYARAGLRAQATIRRRSTGAMAADRRAGLVRQRVGPVRGRAAATPTLRTAITRSKSSSAIQTVLSRLSMGRRLSRTRR